MENGRMKEDVKGIVEEVLREVKGRLDEMERRGNGAEVPTGLVIGEMEEQEERGLRSFCRMIRSPEEGEWDFVVAMEFPAEVMAEVALGIAGKGTLAGWILESFWSGKRVYLMEQGLEYRKYREGAFKGIYHKFQEYEDEIRRFGGEIVSDILAVVDQERRFHRMRAEESRRQEVRMSKDGAGVREELSRRKNAAGGEVFLEKDCRRMDNTVSGDEVIWDLTGCRVLQEADLGRMRGNGYGTVMIGKNTIVTPLAQDFILNHNLVVRRKG